MAENLNLMGLKTSLVEMQSQILAPVDFEVAAFAQNEMRQNGVELILSDGVKAFFENEIELNSGLISQASVPSGASTGINEAFELRDDEKTIYMGKGVLGAVKNVKEKISKALIGTSILEQRKIDEILIEQDGTQNKKNLGANAILGVSLASARLASKFLNIPLYKYLGGINGNILPTPMVNILNGGVHADNNLEFQEFMITPTGADSMRKTWQNKSTFPALMPSPRK